jgi:hypothetical protein
MFWPKTARLGWAPPFLRAIKEQKKNKARKRKSKILVTFLTRAGSPARPERATTRKHRQEAYGSIS